jgi:hypothetical protein
MGHNRVLRKRSTQVFLKNEQRQFNEERIAFSNNGVVATGQTCKK